MSREETGRADWGRLMWGRSFPHLSPSAWRYKAEWPWGRRTSSACPMSKIMTGVCHWICSSVRWEVCVVGGGHCPRLSKILLDKCPFFPRLWLPSRSPVYFYTTKWISGIFACIYAQLCVILKENIHDSAQLSNCAQKDKALFFLMSMWLTRDERHRYTFQACKLRPCVLLHSCWEDGEDDQPLKHSSHCLCSPPPSPSPSYSSVCREAGEVSAGRPSLSQFCCGTSRPPLGLLIWTFRIRICNDTEQSKKTQPITEWRTSDQSEEGPDQTRPLWRNDEPSARNLQSHPQARLPHARRLVSHTLFQVCDLSLSFASKQRKQACYLCGIPRANHPSPPLTAQRERELNPWGDPWFSAAYTLNKESRLNPLLAELYEPKYFFFYPIAIHCCTFVLARLQWLCDRDDRANYIAQKTYTEKRKQSCFSERIVLA